MFTFSVPPVIVMHGPTDVKFGSNVSIRCAVLEGYPSPSVSIITPQGEIINQSLISFNATMNEAGYYTCIANNSVATITRNLSLTVHSKNFTTNDYCMTIHNAEPGLVFVTINYLSIEPYTCLATIMIMLDKLFLIAYLLACYFVMPYKIPYVNDSC